MTKNIVDVISCKCLDAEHWRIKYKISTIVFDDIFKRVTRLESSVANESTKKEQL
jgi:hypothetical protein